jgi:N4-gp56 family major capsid protein
MADVIYPGAGGGNPSDATSGVVHKGPASTFIPEIWSDEVIAAYQKNLKMSPLVKKMAMAGKKGDTVHIPKPIRGSANAKVESTAVKIQANVEEELQVTIDRHFEYSRFIEDIVEVQALNSLRQFYTSDAGYALALQVDTDLMNCATGFGTGTKTLAPADGAAWEGSTWFNDASTGTTAFTDDTMLAADVFTDAFFRDMIQKMDDNDVPMENRVLVIPPVLKNTLTGIERYVSSDFRDGRTVSTGLIGNLYGVDIYVSSNCPTLETAAQNGAADGVASRGALLFHKDAIIHAEQMSVRSQTQYKQEYLSTLYTADTLYGVEVYRPEAGFVLAVPA